MPQWYVMALIPAIGFAAAGMICALLRLAIHDENRIGAFRHLPLGVLLGFVISMFAGPWLVASLTFERWREGRLSRGLATIAPPLTLLWSFCAGVFVIELLMIIGLVAV